MTLTIETIRKQLLPYGISAEDSLCEKVRAYVELLLRWNSKISLTSVTDPAEIVRFHFGESLFGAAMIYDEKSRLADVGSGAGFPGMALKLYKPSLQLSLIEPNVKKATFLAEVGRVLNLNSVEVLRFRMEDLPVDVADFRFITARALGRHEELLRWSRNRLAQGGEVALWISAQDATRLSEDQTFEWKTPSEIPHSDHRVILAGVPSSR